VAVGNESTVVMSENGINWSFATGYSGTSLTCVVSGNGEFVAGTSLGGLYNHTEAYYWRECPKPELDDKGKAMLLFISLEHI